MNQLKKNPLFYLSLILALAIGFQVYGIVVAQTYTGPSAPPTGGMPAQPLDTSISSQTKSGNLMIGTGRSYGAGLSLGQGKGICLPATSADNDVQCKFSWDAIGTGGTGGTGIGWSASGNNDNDITNSNIGNVVIKNGSSLVMSGGKIQSYTFKSNGLSAYTSHNGSCDLSTGIGYNATCSSGYDTSFSGSEKECIKAVTPNPSRGEDSKFYSSIFNSADAAQSGAYYYETAQCTPQIGNYQYFDAISFNNAPNGDGEPVIIKGGLLGYPTIIKEEDGYCTDKDFNVWYMTDGDLSYLQIGGSGPGSEYDTHCSQAAIHTPKWRWSKTSGDMKFCVNALEVKVPGASAIYDLGCFSIGRSTLNKANIISIPGIDLGNGASTHKLNYTLESSLLDTQSYE